jgi:malic enzyme
MLKRMAAADGKPPILALANPIRKSCRKSPRRVPATPSSLPALDYVNQVNNVCAFLCFPARWTWDATINEMKVAAVEAIAALARAEPAMWW